MKLDVAKVLLRMVCCRAHCEQMLSDCLNVLRDVMLYGMYDVAVAIFASGAIETRLAEARLEDRVAEAFRLGCPGCLFVDFLGFEMIGPCPCIFTTCMRHACI